MGLSIKEIVATSRDARSHLLVIDEKLQLAISVLDEISWTRTLNTAERKQRTALRTAQSACSAARIELAYITIQALDQSQEVARLLNAMAAVNKDTEEALEKVKKIVKIAKQVADVTAALEKIAGGLAGLML